MTPVLVNASIAGCRPFPPHDDHALALAWWKDTVLGNIQHVDQLMECWSLAEPTLRSVCESAAARQSIAVNGTCIEAPRIHAPIAPRQVYCIIGNYCSQVIEAAVDAADGPGGAGAKARREAAVAMLDRRRREGTPYICVKPASSVTDPFAELAVAPDMETLDWEVEVGVVSAGLPGRSSAKRR